MQGNLTAPILIKLTQEDSDYLTMFSIQADCTPGQLARYVIRKFIHEKLKEAPAQQGA
jgi:hypothetical protein